MPDWMSHMLIGLIFAELLGIRKKSLVLLGTLLPDLLVKLSLAFFYLGIPPYILFNSFHTPIMCFLLTILIAPLFRYNRFKTIILISVGTISHFLADLTLKHLTGGLLLLFPFSEKRYLLNWIWPEQAIYVIIASLFIYLTILLVKKNQKYITTFS